MHSFSPYEADEPDSIFSKVLSRRTFAQLSSMEKLDLLCEQHLFITTLLRALEKQGGQKPPFPPQWQHNPSHSLSLARLLNHLP